MPFEYNWRRLTVDCSEIELEEFLDRQKAWKKKSSNHESCTVCPVRYSAHTMHYVIYTCNSASCVTSSTPSPCEWYVRSRMCDAAKRGSIDEHGSHNNLIPGPPTTQLNLAMKRFIRDQTQLKLTPSRISNAMIDNGLLPEAAYAYLKCVQRYSYHYRTTAMHDNNNVDEMEALLASHPYHEGLHDSTAFAFGYDIDGAGKPALTRGSTERPVVFGFTSKNLLRDMAHASQHVLHIDATFKLNTARFPAIVIGVSDVRRQFHPVAFFITSDLRHEQVEKIVRATAKQYQIVTGAPAQFRFAGHASGGYGDQAQVHQQESKGRKR